MAGPKDQISINGVPLQDAAVEALAFKPDATITLPSGRVAEIIVRKPTGRDQIKAQQLVGVNASGLEQAYAIFSMRTRIDGRMLTYEEFIDLPYDDLNQIAAKSDPEKKIASSPPLTSPPSSGTESP